MKFKGIAFPSYFRDDGPPKPRLQWVRHQNKAQRVRNLKSTCRHVLASKDPETVALLARVRESVATEPEPEFATLHLVHAAVDACDQTGEKWTTCMSYMLEKFDNMKSDWAEDQARRQAEEAANEGATA